jgi:hypothetical protein
MEIEVRSERYRLSAWLQRVAELARRFALITAVLTSISLEADSQPDCKTEMRAIEFLKQEVPAWSRENGCFSCHNNGDAARALYAATRKGYDIPSNVLADTTDWVSKPDRWDANKGDPGFSDKRLADIQFAAALFAAVEAGHVGQRVPLQEAARRLVASQEDDGAWHIGPGRTLGSPATYGTPLATYLALRTLKAAGAASFERSIQKAENWLLQVRSNDVLSAATILLASAQEKSVAAAGRKQESLRLIRAAQSRDGGWGPYADWPPEPFDTAVVLLALAKFREEPGVQLSIERGRNFLLSIQNPDGGWPATTRPPGGGSYAQRISTTGWVTLALLETGE